MRSLKLLESQDIRYFIGLYGRIVLYKAALNLMVEIKSLKCPACKDASCLLSVKLKIF